MDYYDNYYDAHDYEYDPNFDYDEHEQEDSKFLEYDDGDNNNGHYDNDSSHQYIPEIWKRLRLKQGNTYYIVNISNRGLIKPYVNYVYETSISNTTTHTFQEAVASPGVPLHGTPYMFTRIGTKNYYMHELVWLAFVGPISPGYEVRHKSHYINKKAHKTYSNRAECLELYPSTITRITMNDALHLAE
jgi:hypothetical protein